MSVKLAKYSELKHTWRLREGVMEFRVSDYVANAPEDVKESLAWYLLCRAFSLRCPDQKSEPYLAYVRSRRFWMGVRRAYLARARGLDLSPAGRVRDLRTVFEYVNSFYFRSKLTQPLLAWVTESPRRRLGFYFEQLDLLAVNRVLDSERIPRYVLEFVMYHELLHHRDAATGALRRRVCHTKSFREQERAFRMYSEAEAWLRRIARQKR